MLVPVRAPVHVRHCPPMHARMQTRTHLPVWLGIGEALKKAIGDGNAHLLEEMYNNWPFFQVGLPGARLSWHGACGSGLQLFPMFQL